MQYEFGDFRLDTDRYSLTAGGDLIPVQPQVFDVLSYLIANRERVITKNELLDGVWGDRFVSESALTSRIRSARQALADDGDAQRLIRTVHGRGYQFVGEAAEVETGEPTTAATTAPREMPQQIRFATSADGTCIAHSTVGAGPTLVRAAHWITHLDFEWQSPVWRPWLDGLMAGRTLVRYDGRGMGLSDQDVEDLGIEVAVQDLEAVVENLGLERFPLLGLSQGGAVAIAYAHRHPDKVSKLVIVNGYARGLAVRPNRENARREADLQAELIRLGWGSDDPSFRRFFTANMIPDLSPELWDAFGDLFRRSTSPEMSARICEAVVEIDVSDIAADLDIPTLILHSINDRGVPVEEARHLAAVMPDARLVRLDSNNHLLQQNEAAWPVFLAELDSFLAA
ncbi:MAG: alpha/beta fold hydrolase [Acidimicrobiales bacterium]